ncbi:MAG: hypothetical protein EOP07_02100 [Proteobacteria bacterium]|nr:MAG: hypothetical protein EOP07_02100 [Pseudomonadota bacterium]
MSAILNEHLRGVLYVLDEPSQGLHPREIDRLWAAIERLKAQGNTVIIVDHDPDMMRRADWIIDLGPGGGVQGGMLLAQFAPKDALSFAKVSATALHLYNRSVAPPRVAKEIKFKEFLQIDKPRLNNLKMPRARFPFGALTVVSGVSGAGKSSSISLPTSERSMLPFRKRRSTASRLRLFPSRTMRDVVRNVRVAELLL